ncbi:transposase-like protein [Catenulispora sp. MAP12-49]
MALSQSELLDLLASLRSSDNTDMVRTVLEPILQELIEVDATAAIGAAPFQHSPERINQRNRHRYRGLTTAAGDVDLHIPKLRTGSFFPSLLEQRRRIDQALFAVVMEAYVHGVSTRSVDDLVKALGADSRISKSQVSKICAGLDAEISEFKSRTLDHTTLPYVFLDVTYCKARVTTASLPKPWSSPPASTPQVSGRSSASPSATKRPRPSGSSFYARCGPGDCPGCS